MKKIFCLGEALIDRYKVGDEIKDQVGGAPLNVAGTLAALKNNVYFLGAIGLDVEGQKILDCLTNLKIHPQLVQTTKTPTTIALVELDSNNERNFQFLRGSDEQYAILSQEINEFNQIDFCHFGSATALLGGQLKESYLKLAKFALTKQIPFSFDPNFRNNLWLTPQEVEIFKNECQWYLENANLIKVSDEELNILTNEKGLEIGLRKLASRNSQALICVTQGSKGSTYIWKGKIKFCPTTPSQKVVDTTGAGDAFVAVLINELVKVKFSDWKNLDFQSLDKIVSQANNFAKQVVQSYGALSFLKTIVF